MKRDNRTWNINVDAIFNHPDNPRKDLGDLSELSASIRENGILQNITVMPRECLETPKEDQRDPEEYTPDSYTVLLGHRRLAALRMTGERIVHCNVVWDLSRAEQIGLMMEENAQRNDLTVPEQIESFQLMLDLGETVETISEKTGFSKSTIYKRVRNADVVEEIKSSGYQITVSDLDELSKVGTEQKTEILKNAVSSQAIRQGVDAAIRKNRRKEKLEEVKEKLKSLGLLEWDGEDWYSLVYVTTFGYTDEIPEIEWQGDEYFKMPEYDWQKDIAIRRPGVEEKEVDEEEIRRDEAKEKIKAAKERICDGVRDFIKRMVKERECKTPESEIVKLLTKELAGVHLCDLAGIMLDKRTYQVDKDEIRAIYEEYQPDIRMMAIASLWISAEYTTVAFDVEDYDSMMRVMRILEHEGYTMPQGEDFEIFAGTSDLYTEAGLLKWEV